MQMVNFDIWVGHTKILCLRWDIFKDKVGLPC
jgi:hypothetical protein